MGRAFFILVMLINCLSVCLAREEGLTLTTDQSALLAFRYHISADPYGILSSSWSASRSVCSWIGVTCDVKHARVTTLSLHNMGLNGTIAPHIGNLSFLTTLDLSYNSFHGYIPQETARLHSLKSINLANNYFSGEIPSWFGHLTEVQYLNLGDNNFTGVIPPSLSSLSKLLTLNLTQNSLHGNIPKEIGNHTNLRLYLRDNLLTGSLPSAFFNLSSVEEIDLTINLISDSLASDICHHFPKLRALLLSANQFHGQIPSTLCNCPHLEHLSLAVNQFNGSIPRAIGNLTVLKKLYIDGNELKDSIPQGIGNLTSLEVLSLQNCHLEGSIPPPIFNHSSLRSIDFSNNSLSGSLPQGNQFNLPLLQGIHLTFNGLTGRIPLNLWKCGHLQELSLSYNKFVGSIPAEIGNLTMLKALYLGGNNLTGAIPDAIGNLSLEILSLKENSFSGPIPPRIFNISTLNVMNLHDNHFSGHLPTSMGIWLPNLQELYLRKNGISGIIPISLTNASKLTIIDLGSNLFTGSIPNTLGNLRFLRDLVLGGNNLTSDSELSFFSSLTYCRNLSLLSIALNPLNGILPLSVGNLSTSLRLWQAFGCQIKGEISAGIGNLSSLSTLSLDSNELTGILPAALGKLTDLEALYLEHNRLQGSIPDGLCLLNALGDLYLSDNNLNGSIPSCLGNVKSLRRLYLDSNNLTSTIPSLVWSNKDLVGLNLSSNLLTGYLPLDIGNFKVITEMDLSRNQLLGQIPSSIGGAQLLSFLSLANNRLHGSIPQALGNLLSLETLDLSSNNLSGLIPRSLEALRYLHFLNMSFNRLQGEIPSGGQFSNFTAQSFIGNDALCGATRLNVPLCKNKRSISNVSALKYVLPVIAFAIVVAAFVFMLKVRGRWRLNPSGQDDSLPVDLRRVSYYELIRATDSFSESNLIGRGSYGSVYKGVLSDGLIVAVKVFNLQSDRAMISFNVECEVLRKVRHRNLVKIISSCTNVEFKSLVLQYLPKGSLEKWLYSDQDCCLNMVQRLNIMTDVAAAMEYLHDGQTTTIVHCDLKPNNILLDEDMTARVCDLVFPNSLVKTALWQKLKHWGQSGTWHQVMFLVHDYKLSCKSLIIGNGSLCHAVMKYSVLTDPKYDIISSVEYGMGGRVSASGDVYSYGIVLMETFTRKKPTDDMFSGDVNLTSWVNEALHSSIYQVVDPNLTRIEDERLSAKEQCLSSILSLAMDCTIDSPAERISTADLVNRLAKIKSTFLSSS